MIDKLTLLQLRINFEKMARGKHFNIERNNHGEYTDKNRSTFMLWAGYWESAKANDIIDGEDAEYKNIHK